MRCGPAGVNLELCGHWCFFAAVPMVGFGAMDNFIMIQAGNGSGTAGAECELILHWYAVQVI